MCWGRPLVVVVMCCAAPLQAADVERAGHEDLTPEAWQQLLLGTGQNAALQARAHRLRCTRLMYAFDAPSKAAVAESVAQGLPLAERSRALTEKAGLLVCRGQLAAVSGKPVEANNDFSAALGLTQGVAGEAEGISAHALALRGEQHYQRGELSAAIADLQAAYRMAASQDDVLRRNYALNVLANVYSDERIGQYSQALAYYQELLDFYEGQGAGADAANMRFNIGSVQLRLKQFDEALATFKQAQADFEALGDIASVAECQRSMAKVSMDKGDLRAALAFSEAAVSALTKLDDAGFAARARFMRGVVLRKLGRLNGAAQDFDAAQGQFELEKNPRQLERLWSERAELHAAQQHWEQAWQALKEHGLLREKLHRMTGEEVSARLRIDFDSERREQQNAALQSEARSMERIRRLQTAVIVLGALLLAGIAVLAWRLNRHARQMRTLAMADELTGMPNRRAILDALRTRLSRSEPASALIFDIDHFKRINDRLGHDVGDEVLKKVSACANDALGTEGQVGRIGGEEFLVVLPGADQARMAQVAERLRAAVAALAFPTLAEPLSVTISLGGAAARPGETVPEALLKRADLALYDAKEGGRNRACLRLP
jgi:diguanylate cyclase (GGDEF)-like protein